MVITLQKIFRDAMNSFPGDVDDFEFLQVSNWINEAYVDLKNEYLKNNRHEQFAIEDTFGTFSDFDQIPYLKKASLVDPINQLIPINNAVITVVCRLYDELATEATVKTKGTKRWKGLDLFEAVSEVPAIDSSDLTFTKYDVRSYFPGNQLKYKEGQVVFENDNAYRAVSDVVATSSDPLSGQVEWEQVYWKRIGIGFVDPVIIPLSKYDRKKSIVDSGGVVLVINKDEIYITKNVSSMYIQYVPEHVWKTEFEDTFTIPDGVFEAWRSMIHRKMYAALGQTIGESDES